MQYLRVSLAGFVLAGLCLTAPVQGAKAPHIPGVVDEATLFTLPEFQDVSSAPIVVGKTIFEGYTPIETTITLTLVQDSRGKIVGTASTASTHPTGGASFPVTGKLKGAKGSSTFKLKGKTALGESGRKANINITASMVEFDPVDLSLLEPGSTDYRSNALYDIGVKINGLGYNYNFRSLVNVFAKFNIWYDLAPEKDTFGLKVKPNSDYYLLITPWGATLADGTFQVIDGNGYFTLKAKGFSMVDVDYDFDGENFMPEWSTVKSPSASFSGPVTFTDIIDLPQNTSEITAPRGFRSKGQP